jgi:hypothetical protein
MPEPPDLAKIYEFADPTAMEADFMKYLLSTDFR